MSTFAAVSRDSRVIGLIAPRGTIDRVAVARSFYARGLGLLARSDLYPSEGLLFVPGGSVHTFGMRFAIDVVFMSERFEVLDVAESIRPWRIVLAPRRTRLVIELRAYAARDVGIVRGSSLHPVANRKQHSSRAWP
jgi:uncharacterized membrane protein (UPF0127 family)